MARSQIEGIPTFFGAGFSLHGGEILGIDYANRVLVLDNGELRVPITAKVWVDGRPAALGMLKEGDLIRFVLVVGDGVPAHGMVIWEDPDFDPG